MVIFYKKYESSFLATVISFFASFFLLFGVVKVITGEGIFGIGLGVVLFIMGIGLKLLAKSIAKDEHIRKLSEDIEYSKKFIEENPEAKEYCVENNPEYAKYYEGKIGKANFAPNDYRPC